MKKILPITFLVLTTSLPISMAYNRDEPCESAQQLGGEFAKACSGSYKEMNNISNETSALDAQTQVTMKKAENNAITLAQQGQQPAAVGAAVNNGVAKETALSNATKRKEFISRLNSRLETIRKANELIAQAFEQLKSQISGEYQNYANQAMANNAKRAADEYNRIAQAVQNADISSPGSIPSNLTKDEREQLRLHAYTKEEYDQAQDSLDVDRQSHSQEVTKLEAQASSFNNAQNANQLNANSLSGNGNDSAAAAAALAGAAGGGKSGGGTESARGSGGSGGVAGLAGGSAGDLTKNSEFDTTESIAARNARGESKGKAGTKTSDGSTLAATSSASGTTSGGGSGLSSSTSASKIGSTDLKNALDARLNAAKAGVIGGAVATGNGSAAGATGAENTAASTEVASAVSTPDLGDGNSSLGLAGSETDSSIKDMMQNMFGSLMGDDASTGRGLASTGGMMDAQGNAMAPNNNDIGGEEGTPLYSRVRETIKRQFAKGNIVKGPKSKI